MIKISSIPVLCLILMKALWATRQAFYALYDQAIHGPVVPESTTALWAKRISSVGKASPTLF